MNETQKRPNRYDQGANIVKPEPKAEILPAVRPLTPEESQALQMPIPTLPQQPLAIPGQRERDSKHIRHTDDPLTNAKASKLYGREIGIWGSVGISGLLLLAWLNYGGDSALYIGFEILGVSGAMLLALVVNRHQGLKYSAPGIAHAEIKADVKTAKIHAEVEIERIRSQERVATHAIDKHTELLAKRLGVSNDE